MTSNKELTQLIEKELEKYSFKGEPKELYDPLNYIIKLGGKRLRPQLTLLSCEMFGGRMDRALKPALGIEVFHNFTLLHDDIMDRAPLRRGKETVHMKWGEPTAILSGDLMLVKAYELMMHVEDTVLRDVLDLFNQTAAGVCEGQQMDMNFEQRNSVTVEEYLKMINLKTAILLGCALKTGALVAGAGVEQADLIYDYGVQMGMGFQLMDDILDIYGDEAAVGKQKGGDILSEKKTFLLLKAIELAEDEDKAILSEWIGKAEASPENKIEAVMGVYNKLKIRELATERSNHYFKTAERLLDAVNVEKERKLPLIGFSSWLKNRTS